MYIEKLNET